MYPTQAHGSDTSQWTKTNVQDSGVLLDSLTSSHISSFTVFDDDVLSTLGAYTYANNVSFMTTSSTLGFFVD